MTMILAEFDVNHPALRRTLAETPETRLTWERSDVVDDGRVQTLLWADGDIDAFGAALDDDPTVSTSRRLTETDERDLFRLQLAEDDELPYLYPLLVEEDALVRKLTVTASKWQFRVVFPQWQSFEQFRDFCREHDFDIEVRRLQTEATSEHSTGFPGLTDRQRELLVATIDTGYLKIPREASLSELGDHLDVSPNSASQLFRRGVKSLIEQTVYPTANGES
ncbi:helix-turn-helix domain-containing protein [Halorussus halophilus]|uniref:helix-turn-helix domain-containing protein n=1 Tax=Halorussus halophilus TaxID=2650975 RepID=UPI001301445F|nr:bacterio-opsin activator domain-containing protein [Halorussus halophilus]